MFVRTGMRGVIGQRGDDILLFWSMGSVWAARNYVSTINGLSAISLVNVFVVNMVVFALWTSVLGRLVVRDDILEIFAHTGWIIHSVRI